MRVVLLFGPLVPRLAASTAAHLSGSLTVPWPLQCPPYKVRGRGKTCGFLYLLQI
jgi:hypothetical protein